MMTAPFPYPGIPATVEGAEQVVHVETAICQGAGAYPITSSTTMAHGFAQHVADGKPNLWGDRLAFVEPESEHSSASFCEGFALAGGRVTNFTSGQGLVLMKEVLYTISGKRLPAVFHIGARALTSHTLNVHAGHDDVMAVADCGWGMLFAKNAQDVGDLALIARRVAEDTETPFMNIMDGFLTTHTVERVQQLESELMEAFVGHPSKKLRNLMNPHEPVMSGVVQNQDSYMKGKIAQRFYYDNVAPRLQAAFDEFYRLTGRRYGMIEPYRMEDAEYVLVGMGSLIETAFATVDWLRAERGILVGAVNVVAFRPFPAHALVEALRGARCISVIERMDNPLASSNPLTCEIKAAFCDAHVGTLGLTHAERIPRILSGAAGLGGRDVRPGDLVAVVDNMLAAEEQQKTFFCLGIRHPLALERGEDPDLRPPSAFSMRGHSIGGFGSVTTNKLIATLVGETFGLYVQAYPLYGSEKKGLPTKYYLTIAEGPIRTHCELNHVDFIALNDVNAFNLGAPLEGIMPGGMIFIQSPETNPRTVWAGVPAYAQKAIREKGVRVLALDTVGIAREVTAIGELVVRMQGIVLLGIFLKVTPYQQQRGLSDEELFDAVETVVRAKWGKLGDRVVQDNMTCIKRGFNEVFEVPQEIIRADAAYAADV